MKRKICFCVQYKERVLHTKSCKQNISMDVSAKLWIMLREHYAAFPELN